MNCVEPCLLLSDSFASDLSVSEDKSVSDSSVSYLSASCRILAFNSSGGGRFLYL